MLQSNVEMWGFGFLSVQAKDCRFFSYDFFIEKKTHFPPNAFSWKGGLLQGKERKTEKYRLVLVIFFLPFPQNPKFWGKFSVGRERSFCLWFLPSVSAQLRCLIPHSMHVPQPPQSQWGKAPARLQPQC